MNYLDKKIKEEAESIQDVDAYKANIKRSNRIITFFICFMFTLTFIVPIFLHNSIGLFLMFVFLILAFIGYVILFERKLIQINVLFEIKKTKETDKEEFAEE